MVLAQAELKCSDISNETTPVPLLLQPGRNREWEMIEGKNWRISEVMRCWAKKYDETMIYRILKPWSPLELVYAEIQMCGHNGNIANDKETPQEGWQRYEGISLVETHCSRISTSRYPFLKLRRHLPLPHPTYLFPHVVIRLLHYAVHKPSKYHKVKKVKETRKTRTETLHIKRKKEVKAHRGVVRKRTNGTAFN